MGDSRSSLCFRLLFSSFRARFSSLRSILCRRFSAFSSASSSSGFVGVGAFMVDIGLIEDVVVVVVVVPVAGFLAGSKPLQKKRNHEQ